MAFPPSIYLLFRWFQSAKDAQPVQSTADQLTGAEMLMEQTPAAVIAFTG
jgi:hypothetical protein